MMERMAGGRTHPRVRRGINMSENSL
jgi:hypothetical protein